MRKLIGIIAMALAVAGCSAGQSPTVEPTPASGIRLTAKASVTGNVATIDVTSSGLQIVKADGDTSGKTGHYHVFVDEEPTAPGSVIAKTRQIVHSTDSAIKIYGLTPGKHEFHVVVGDGAHTRLGSAMATASATVTSASVQASVPASIAANTPFTVDVKVEGLTLVKADGDTSGRTGHLHVFVGKDPTPAGQPIPAGDPAIIHSATPQVTVPGLAAGEHTIWVVAGDGAHNPLVPQVVDKVTFTIAGAAAATATAAPTAAATVAPTAPGAGGY